MVENISFLDSAKLVNIVLKYDKVTNNHIKKLIIDKVSIFLQSYEKDKFCDKMKLKKENIKDLSNLYTNLQYKNMKAWRLLKKRFFYEFNNFSTVDKISLMLDQIDVGKYNIKNNMKFYHRIQNELSGLNVDDKSSSSNQSNSN